MNLNFILIITTDISITAGAATFAIQSKDLEKPILGFLRKRNSVCIGDTINKCKWAGDTIISYAFISWCFWHNIISKGCNFVMLRQIIEKYNRSPLTTENILHITSKFQFDRTCFWRGDASTNFRVSNTVVSVSPIQTQ